jgi:hypothetical protein
MKKLFVSYELIFNTDHASEFFSKAIKWDKSLTDNEDIKELQDHLRVKYGKKWKAHIFSWRRMEDGTELELFPGIKGENNEDIDLFPSEKIVKSKCKLDEFNFCPGKDIILKAPTPLNIVDAFEDEKDYLQNQSDTLVFEAPIGDTVGFMKFVAEAHCSEFEIEEIDGKKIIRMWWD